MNVVFIIVEVSVLLWTLATLNRVKNVTNAIAKDVAHIIEDMHRKPH
jgi:hypothetical protein